jgi:hypothetical protein
MSALTISVTLAGMGEVDMMLHELRNSLADRGPLHANMAVRGQQFTQAYLRGLNRHRSAGLVGASPSGFREKNAAVVEAQSDKDSALVVIPADTGLRRAFQDIVLQPGSGRTYLTIPAHQETYGKSVRDFPEDAFRFAVLESFRTFVTLMWREDGGGHKAGEVAYWLKRQVTQKQDRTLLPSDEGYAEIGRRGAVEYLTGVLENA